MLRLSSYSSIQLSVLMHAYRRRQRWTEIGCQITIPPVLMLKFSVQCWDVVYIWFGILGLCSGDKYCSQFLVHDRLMVECCVIVENFLMCEGMHSIPETFSLVCKKNTQQLTATVGRLLDFAFVCNDCLSLPNYFATILLLYWLGIRDYFNGGTYWVRLQCEHQLEIVHSNMF